MVDEPLEPYRFVRMPVFEALRISDVPVRSPRARIRIARHLVEAANVHGHGITPVEPTTEEKQRLTKQLGPDSDTWWGVAEVCKQDLLHGRITPAQLKDRAKAI